MLGNAVLRYHSGKKKIYCPSFIGDNIKVTVHSDMNRRTYAFAVNGVKYPGISDLPSKLYPVVSLCYPGRLRIQPH